VSSLNAQATKPTTSPAKIPENVKSLLDEAQQAYSTAKSLEMSGTISFQFKAGEESREFSAPFNSSFRAPTQFRHEVKDDSLVISSSDKAYVFLPAENSLLTAPAPKKTDGMNELPVAMLRLLADQNPSLLFAITSDFGKQLLDGATQIALADDLRIAGVPFPAINFTRDSTKFTYAFDPRTHFIRQVRLDRADQMKKRGRDDVRTAMLTIDYAKTTGGQSIPDSAFTWIPPKDVKTMRGDVDGDSESEQPDQPVAALVGKPAPDFTLNDLEGKAVTLAELKGSVVVLDFWATWCGPCVASMPHLDKLFKDKSPDGLKVFAVNLREPKAAAEKFIRTKQLTLPVLLDGKGEVAKKYLVSGIPQTVVIGKDGLITKVIVGFGGDDSELRAAVDAAMSAN